MNEEARARIASMNAFNAKCGKPLLTLAQERAVAAKAGKPPNRQECGSDAPLPDPPPQEGRKRGKRGKQGPPDRGAAVPKRPYRKAGVVDKSPLHRKKKWGADKPKGEGGKKGVHWFPVSVPDLRKIKNSQAPEAYPIALAVWCALLEVASRKCSLAFEASDSFLVNCIPGAKSRNTIRKATGILEALGMLKSETGKIPGTKQLLPLTRTIYPSGKFFRVKETENAPAQADPEPTDNTPENAPEEPDFS